MNQDKISNTSIVLSDISQGMVEDARDNLKNFSNIKYNCFDCHLIPYEDECFDVVIANHVLFYLSDINSALKEIKRVLKPNGIFYCSTYGVNHMKEITDLIKEYNPKITLSNVHLYDVFGLENGKEILSQFFNKINLKKHEDYLIVDNADDITNYILSCHGNQVEYILKDSESFKKYIEKKVNSSIKITKDAGMFICYKSANNPVKDEK